MKKNDLREKIHLTSVDELFGLENAEVFVGVRGCEIAGACAERTGQTM